MNIRFLKEDEKVRSYFLNYLALLALLGTTLALAFLPLGSLNTVISVFIAFLKTVLIAAFFMHLKDELPLTRIFSLAGIAWLAILFSLALSDYLSRHWMISPGHWPSSVAGP